MYSGNFEQYFNKKINWNNTNININFEEYLSILLFKISIKKIDLIRENDQINYLKCIHSKDINKMY